MVMDLDTRVNNIFRVQLTYHAYRVSHVVGVEVLQIYFLLSRAGGWLSQHCCDVAKAILIKSQ